MSALNRPLDLSTCEQPMTIDMTQDRFNILSGTTESDRAQMQMNAQAAGIDAATIDYTPPVRNDYNQLASNCGSIGSLLTGNYMQPSVQSFLANASSLQLEQLAKELPAYIERKLKAAQNELVACEKLQELVSPKPPPKDAPAAPEDTYDCPCRACRKPTTATR